MITEEAILFGTYDVPPINESLSSSFTAPGIPPKEEMDKISFYTEKYSSFDRNLKKALEYIPKHK